MGETLGLGFGSFFVFGCLSFFFFFFFFFFLLLRVAACPGVFFGFITSCSHSLFFFTKKLNDYLSLTGTTWTKLWYRWFKSYRDSKIFTVLLAILGAG
jgi:hypothetical protein